MIIQIQNSNNNTILYNLLTQFEIIPLIKIIGYLFQNLKQYNMNNINFNMVHKRSKSRYWWQLDHGPFSDRFSIILAAGLNIGLPYPSLIVSSLRSAIIYFSKQIVHIILFWYLVVQYRFENHFNLYYIVIYKSLTLPHLMHS